MSRIAILGGGAWGTALALSLARRSGHDLILWCHSPALAEQLRNAGENSALPPRASAPPRRRQRHRRSSPPPSSRPISSSASLPRSISARPSPTSLLFSPPDKSFSAPARASRSSATCACRRSLQPLLTIPSPCSPDHPSSPSEGRHWRFAHRAGRRRRAQSRRRPAHSARLLLPHPPRLHQRRRRRRRTWRRTQKRRRHGLRSRARTQPRSQLRRRPHHPRHRRDHPPRPRLRRPPSDPRRPIRPRRPGPYLHRIALPQSLRRHRARPRPVSFPISSRASTARSPKASPAPPPHSASPHVTASRCPSPSR